MKIKAHALYLALIVSLVITVLCGSIIFLGYYYRSQTDQAFNRLQLAANVQSGINYLLAQNTSIPLNIETATDLYRDGKDSVTLERRSWGVFQIGLSKATKGRDEVHKAFLFGGENNNFCLYLADQGRPLSVCGRAVLKGDVLAPKAGVKRARVEGQYFVGEKLVWGKIKESTAGLPKLNDEVVSEVLKKVGAMNGGTEEWPDSVDAMIHSYFENTKIIEISGGVFTGKIKGNVVLVAKQTIIIAANASVNDVIIVAPGVIFKNGFKGSLQAFATDSIIVEENVELTYPSAVGVVKGERSVQQPFVRVLSGAKVRGTIFTYALKKDRFKTKVSLNKQSVLVGDVYADGYLDLKGEIKGSAVCSSFLLVTPSSVYENYLLNSTIDRYALPNLFVGSLLTNNNFSSKVVIWLY